MTPLRLTMVATLLVALGCAKSELPRARSSPASAVLHNVPTPGARKILIEQTERAKSDLESLQAKINSQSVDFDKAQGLHRDLVRESGELELHRGRLRLEVQGLEEQRKALAADVRSTENKLVELREKQLDVVLQQLAEARQELREVREQIDLEHQSRRAPAELKRAQKTPAPANPPDVGTKASRSELERGLRESLMERATKAGCKLIQSGTGDSSAPAQILRRAVASNGYETFYYSAEGVNRRLYVRLWTDTFSKRMYYRIE